jgi:hypothetical protein
MGEGRGLNVAPKKCAKCKKIFFAFSWETFLYVYKLL